MISIKISSNFFGKYQTEKELYEKVKIWVQKNLVGTIIPIEAIDKAVELSWQGLKNDLNEYHPPYDKKLISFAVLPQMITNSKFLVKEKDKANKPDVKAVYKFLGSVNIDNEEFDVIIFIKETAKTYIYDHVLLQKK